MSRDETTRYCCYYYSLVAFLGISGYYFVASLTTLLGINNTSLSIAIRSVVLVFSLLLFLMLILGRLRLATGQFSILLGAFWFMYCIRLYWDTYVSIYPLFWPPEDYWIWAIGVTIIPSFALLLKVRVWWVYQSIFKWIYFTLFMSGLVILFVGTKELTLSDGSVLEIDRLNLSALNAISVGNLGVSLFLLSLFGFLNRVGWIWSRNLFILTAILGLYLAVESGSRGPIVCLIAVSVVWVSFKNRLSDGFLYLTAQIIFFLVMFFVVSTLDWAGIDRFRGAIDGSDSSALGRMISQEAAFYQFLESPIIGSSIVDHVTGYYPHNIILEAFMATGVFGGILLLAIMFVGFINVNKLLRTSSENGWVGLLFVQYFTAAQFSGALYTVPTLWVLLSLTVAVNKSIER